MGMIYTCEQISLFDDAFGAIKAVSCFDGSEANTRELFPHEKRLVRDGAYVVDIGGHALVLRPTSTPAAKIPAGHEFYHYLIDQRVFSGIFVGEENDG